MLQATGVTGAAESIFQLSIGLVFNRGKLTMTWDQEGFVWHNPPADQEICGGTLRVKTRSETDSWRETIYGYWKDSAHILSRQIEGDFTAEVTIKGQFEFHWDQAGLILRLSESHWVKIFMENISGALYFIVTVTNNASDASIMQIPVDPQGNRVRATRIRDTVRADYFDFESESWKTARIAPFPRSKAIGVGVTCASPIGEGLDVSFWNFSTFQPIE